MGTTNLIGLLLFYVQIEHVRYDFESSPSGLCVLCCQILRIFYRFQKISLKPFKGILLYIKDLLSFTLLIIQHDQLISFCDLNVCKLINKNRPVELLVSTETLVLNLILIKFQIIDKYLVSPVFVVTAARISTKLGRMHEVTKLCCIFATSP